MSNVGGDNITVNFIKPLSSTKFSIRLTKTAAAGNSTAYGTCVNSWTTTNMIIGIYAGNGCFWEVGGYIN